MLIYRADDKSELIEANRLKTDQNQPASNSSSSRSISATKAKVSRIASGTACINVLKKRSHSVLAQACKTNKNPPWTVVVAFGRRAAVGESVVWVHCGPVAFGEDTSRASIDSTLFLCQQLSVLRESCWTEQTSQTMRRQRRRRRVNRRNLRGCQVRGRSVAKNRQTTSQIKTKTIQKASFDEE